MVEYKIISGSTVDLQIKLNEWRHDYSIKILGMSATDNAVIIFLARKPLKRYAIAGGRLTRDHYYEYMKRYYKKWDDLTPDEKKKAKAVYVAMTGDTDEDERAWEGFYYNRLNGVVVGDEIWPYKEWWGGMSDIFDLMDDSVAAIDMCNMVDYETKKQYKKIVDKIFGIIERELDRVSNGEDSTIS